jgi:hypothetical protein
VGSRPSSCLAPAGYKAYIIVVGWSGRSNFTREGPRLGRPLVDRVKGSSLHNLKELRPASAGSSEIRILFAFDPVRRALLLVAGDKSGNWRGWYNLNIPIAEQRFRAHLSDGEEG